MDLKLIPVVPFQAPPSKSPDPITATCIADAKLHQANLINQGIRNDIKARKKYAKRAFYIVVWWLIFMGILLLLQGFLGHSQKTDAVSFRGFSYTATRPSWFFLSDNVLIAAISGTTASVIGIFGFVMKYLFPTSGNSSVKKPKSN